MQSNPLLLKQNGSSRKTVVAQMPCLLFEKKTTVEPFHMRYLKAAQLISNPLHSGSVSAQLIEYHRKLLSLYRSAIIFQRFNTLSGT